MYENFGALDASVQEKLDADVDFNTSLETLSDDEKAEAIKVKKSELLDVEIKSLSETSKKNKELADNQKTRAEKAEQELKRSKPAESILEKKDDLSPKDVLALAKANLHEDDLEEVIEFARFKKIEVTDALKNPTLKTILTEKAEFRKTADATTTGQQRRVATKVTDEALLDKASKGEIPEKGSPEAEQLFWAKRGGKK